MQICAHFKNRGAKHCNFAPTVTSTRPVVDPPMAQYLSTLSPSKELILMGGAQHFCLKSGVLKYIYIYFSTILNNLNEFRELNNWALTKE